MKIFLLCIFVIAHLEAWEPDFLIVGAQRSGTTALHQNILRHPKVVKTGDEVHFFDHHYEKGLEWYQKQFAERPQTDHLIGDKSPFYIIHPHVPQRIFTHYPHMKIIMMLRNPVDRAYSQYWMNIRGNTEPLSFAQAIDNEWERIAGEYDKIVQNPFYNSYNFRKYSYQTRGIYIDQIRRWLEYFPREQILIITNDELRKYPQETMSKVFSFLNLENFPLEFPSASSTPYPPMTPEIRERLCTFFRPYNQELENFLERELRWDH